MKSSEWLDTVGEGALTEKVSHWQLLKLIFMGHAGSVSSDGGGGCGWDRTGDEKSVGAPHGVSHTPALPHANKGDV